MRSGSDYIGSLDDNRDVRLDGKRVENVAGHPAFRGVVQTMAHLYDSAHEPDSVLVDPETGQLGIFTIPRTAEQSILRRRALEKWSELAHGFIGRGPDHVAGLLAGFSSNPDLFNDGDSRYGDNVVAFQKYAAERSLWITNSIVPPQANPFDQTSRVRPIKKVRETDQGIIVSGAQMLATGGAVADEVFVTSVRPLKEGEEDRALTFIIPINTAGLRLICRRPYASAGEPFDYPLSNQFDETDSMLAFDEVLVPWDRVFVNGSIRAINSQFFGTAAHALGNVQSIIRLAAKLKFVTGLASKAAKANGRDANDQTRQAITDVAMTSTVIDALVESSFTQAKLDEHGIIRPAGKFLYAALGMQTETYPRAIKILAELVGGGVIQVPSSNADLTNDEERASMDLLMGSDQLPLDDRVKLFKLVWDVVGSEFAGRHVQYERFYSGSPSVVKGYAYRHYPFDEVESLVDDFMDTYDLTGIRHMPPVKEVNP